METIGVVIPHHNHIEFLGDCLKSIEAQTRKPDKVVVVDDGTEGLGLSLVWSFTIAPKLEKEGFQFVRLMKNMGVAAALRAGLAVLDTDYFAVVAADDMIKPTFIEALHRAAHEEMEDFAYCDFEEFGSSSAICKVAPKWPPGELDYANNMGGCFLMQRRAYDECGGYLLEDGNWCDWGLWLSLRKHFSTGVHVPEPLYLYRRHPGQLTARYTDAQTQKLRENLMKNHGVRS